jgi:uncharacterized membrane protein
VEIIPPTRYPLRAPRADQHPARALISMALNSQRSGVIIFISVSKHNTEAFAKKRILPCHPEPIKWKDLSDDPEYVSLF